MIQQQVDAQDYFVTRGGETGWKAVRAYDPCMAIHTAYELGTPHGTDSSFVQVTYDNVHIYSLEASSGWVKDDYEFYYAIAVDQCPHAMDRLPTMPKCDSQAMEIARVIRFNFGICVPKLSKDKTPAGTQHGSMMNAMKAIYRVATGHGHAKAAERVVAAVDLVHRRDTLNYLIREQKTTGTAEKVPN